MFPAKLALVNGSQFRRGRRCTLLVLQCAVYGRFNESAIVYWGGALSSSIDFLNCSAHP